MKAIDILKAVTYDYPEGGCGVICYDDYDQRLPLRYLMDWFGIDVNNECKSSVDIDKKFEHGQWFFVYSDKLQWADYRERIEHNEQTEPDISLGDSENNITIYLYKID